jgi:cephalosporin hydroxylase
MNAENSWHNSVPNGDQFEVDKKDSLSRLARNVSYRKKGLDLLLSLNNDGFSHKNSWLGVPIIRLPEDIPLQQELIWREKPDLIIEIGIARGGGLIFNASIQELSGLKPNVFGIDNKVYPHTHEAIENSRYSNNINILEGESTSMQTLKAVTPIIKSSCKTLLILDSDHSSKHVLNELNLYVPLLPINSLVIVCDTIIDELPAGTYPNRTWSDGKGPGHALKIFMLSNKYLSFYMEDESKSLVLSEIRDGFFKKTSE